MYSEIAERITELRPLKPFPKACERGEYQSLPEVVKEKAVSKAEGYLNYEFKGIPITAFMEYSRTGNRSHFENLNFEKRHALNALIIGECVEHTGRFMDDIVNGIYSLCEESAWQLPAHNSYERGGENFPLPDVTEPVVDLFAAETGALLACAYYLLSDELDNVSPFIQKMIRDNLHRRIYEPYLFKNFWWIGDKGNTNNWTVWCTQNVLNSVFFMDKMAEPFRKTMVKKAAKSLDAFLNDYGEDGCCDEGPHYYRRSALCLFNATYTLNDVTDGAFESVFSDTKIKNIAEYIMNVNVDGRYYFNFSDAQALLDRSGAGEFLAAKAIGNAEMMRYAAKDYKLSLEENLPRNEEEINLYNLMQSLFTAKEMLEYPTDVPVVHKDLFYESTGLFIARDPIFALAVKSGDNDDSHNHNDTGSITLYKNGKPILIDVGVETYTAKTFSKDRYDIWTMQSAYHNLPTINGVMEAPGAEYRAENVDYSFAEKEARISMDIAKAYPESAGIYSYKREVSLIRGEKIQVRDHAVFCDARKDNSYTLSLMFCEKPEIKGNTIKLADAKIEFHEEVMLSCEVIPVTDDRLKWSWKGELYRVTVKPSENSVSFVIS